MKDKKVWFEEPSNFKGRGAVVKFFGRKGGLSESPYQSLNTSYKVGDNPESVQKNRRIIADILQTESENLVTVRQEHGTKIVEANRPFINPPLADGIYTTNPDIVLCILTADCIPLFAFDPDKKIMLAAHIGWRGALERFPEIIISKLKDLSSNVKVLLLALGPSIKRCCYRVDMDFYKKFEKELWRDYEIDKYFSEVSNNFLRGSELKPTFMNFDLTEITLDQLERLGVKREQIYVSPYCTCCRQDLFFSYRRDGQKSGRQISCGRLL